MKKVLAFVLAMVMTASFAACGGDGSNAAGDVTVGASEEAAQ